MTQPDFIHLRVHSTYSLLEGAIRVGALIETAARLQLPALAVTDSNNLFGALEIAEGLSAKGVQPIIGATLSLYENIGADAVSLGTIALLAKDETGYETLMRLVSAAHLQGDGGVTLDMVCGDNEGLIGLSGGADGPADRALRQGQTSRAHAFLSKMHDAFGDRFYIELQRYPDFGTDETEPQLIDFAYDKQIPLVATNQCFFEAEADYHAHDALLCIAEGAYVVETERRRLTPHHRLKTPEEMVALFSDLPEALANTVEIAQRCAYRPTTRAPILPSFGVADEAAELRQQSEAGLQKRLEAIGDISDAQRAQYKERLDYELGVIHKMGFDGYFLIVADFIQWAKQNAIAVGPGRGSGAGSVVAWALTITDLDPLRLNLLFERFLNPERISMPDFDIDFCQTRRDEVITYVQEKYGRDQVAQIITFGTLQPRAALRDVGRVLQLPYSKVDELCRMVPNNPANPMSLQQAIDSESRLSDARDNDPAVAEMFEIVHRLEGLYRHASTHAAGVVIGDRPLEELVALYRDPKSDMPVTQFNMKWVEKAGLVKFDFLGLKTLTVLEKARELLTAQNIAVDFTNLALDDEKTYALLGEGDTVGVFQLESAGMRDVLRKMKPDCFEDIIALVALYRPGPMDNIPTYIACKQGSKKPDYLYSSLQPILEETYGVMIYQEQVMQIAQELSGYSLGEADVLRRAMGKKDKAEMAAQRARFIQGAEEKHDVKTKQAGVIFDQVDQFAGYGFNKSHAAAYALIAYQTAWLKANHPHVFYAASMTLDSERTDKLDQFVQDARRREIEICPPDVTRSGVDFRIDGARIYYALAAIRNVGHQAAEEIVKAREAGEPFADVFDFARRAGASLSGKREVAALTAAGALDALEPNRARLVAGIEILLGEAGIARAETDSQQDNLFGEAEVSASLELPNVAEWQLVERLTQEAEAIGFYLSGHPLDAHKKARERVRATPIGELERRANEAVIVGTIMKIDNRKSKTGRAFAYLRLSDPSGQAEVMLFSEVLMKSRALLEVGKHVVLGVKIERDGGRTRLTAQSVRALDMSAEDKMTGLLVYIDDAGACQSLKQRLEEARAQSEQGAEQAGQGAVSLMLIGTSQEVELKLDGQYALTPHLSSAIKALPGIMSVREI